MQYQILLVIHTWIQGNLEGESGNLSEVTLRLFSRHPCNNYCGYQIYFLVVVLFKKKYYCSKTENE